MAERRGHGWKNRRGGIHRPNNMVPLSQVEGSQSKDGPQTLKTTDADNFVSRALCQVAAG